MQVQDHKSILIKISGESLKDAHSKDIFSKDILEDLTNQIITLKRDGYEISIVVGGGNIWRGNLSSEIGIDSQTGDYMGMIATMINAQALRKLFKNKGIDSEIYSSLPMPSFSKYFNQEEALEDVKDKILIFACGTGYPSFTTDSCAALRCMQLNCSLLLMGKNGVDGVYNKDPKLHKDASHYQSLTYEEIIQKRLKVMDQTALTLCKDQNTEIRVFNILEKDSILNVIEEKNKFTLIKD